MDLYIRFRMVHEWFFTYNLRSLVKFANAPGSIISMGFPVIDLKGRQTEIRAEGSEKHLIMELVAP